MHGSCEPHRPPGGDEVTSEGRSGHSLPKSYDHIWHSHPNRSQGEGLCHSVPSGSFFCICSPPGVSKKQCDETPKAPELTPLLMVACLVSLCILAGHEEVLSRGQGKREICSQVEILWQAVGLASEDSPMSPKSFWPGLAWVPRCWTHAGSQGLSSP